MDDTKIVLLEKPKLNNPVFIEGLPGVGYIGRNVAGYLIHDLKAKKFAELYSHHFPPVVLLDSQKTGKISELKNEFYYVKAKNKDQRDLIVLIGDAQSADPLGHYEIVQRVIEFAKQFKVKEVITLGGFATGQIVDPDVKVYGAAISEKIIEKFEKLKVQFKESNIGQIIGASGLLVVAAHRNNIDAVCLMGETSGVLLSDPKATEVVLQLLSRYLNLNLDLSKLEEKVKETEVVLKKIEDLEKKVAAEAGKGKEEKVEKTDYIG